MGRLAAAKAELAGRGFDVMAIGPDAALKAAFTATAARSTPIVFRAVDHDPLAKGYIGHWLAAFRFAVTIFFAVP